jgi:2-succinyl-5-enolpyruvyl-6-hydroxy-3-cyclohexene-1-carboxylate synthase
MDERNLLSEWARLFATSLADAGITDVVISPGSRSAPWMLAAVREPRLTCHDVIDERAAAFFALGQARITGRATALLCTSGSAPAHYFPAVVEASAARLPLLVVTADRPFELQDCGAPQTTDQTDLYGRHARRCFELGMPNALPTVLRGLRRMVAQAVFATRHPDPGPVQLNARARKPLEPFIPESKAEHELAELASAIAKEPITMALPPSQEADAAIIEACARACAAEPNGIIMCGPAPLSHAGLAGLVADLAEHLGYPVLCESTSQLRFLPQTARSMVRIDRFELILRSREFRKECGPSLALDIGGTPTSARWETYLDAEPRCRRIMVAPHIWSDPHGTASMVLNGAPAATLARLRDTVSAIMPARPNTAWLSKYQRANRAVAHIVDEEIPTPAGDVMSEGQAIRAAMSAIPRGSLLVIGNSLPIREIDIFSPAQALEFGVLSQRGTNGIDGILAGAAGAAAASRRAITVLLGDVSFLHDATSLALCRSAETSLVIAVIQNRGGRIFELLPMAKVADADIMKHMVTPENIDLSGFATAYGVPFERVEREVDVVEAMQRAHARSGCTLIELIVPDHDAADCYRRVMTRLDTAELL